MKSWMVVLKNPYFFGIISGFLLFSYVPYLLHGAESGVMPFLFMALSVFVATTILLKNEKQAVQSQEKLPGLKAVEKFYLALCLIIVAIYSLELYGQYHINRLISGMAVVLLLYLPRIKLQIRLIIFAVVILYFLRILEEYSRVYLGVYLTVLLGLVFHMVLYQPKRQWNFGIGLKIILITCICLFLPIGVLAVIGFRGEEFFSSFSKGLLVINEGLGFDVNNNTAYILSHYKIHEFDWFHSVISLIANPIPRELWDNKPVTFGAVLSGYYFDVEVDEVFTTLGPGLFGELYANGGYIIMTFIIIVLAVIFKGSWLFIKSSCNAYEVSLIFWMLASLSAFLYRGDFLNGMVNLILRLIPIYVYIYIYKINIKSKNYG